MKVLVTTQAIDAADPILGFFVRWIEELGKRVDHIEAVCLREGEHALPQNVRVHPLYEKGKRHSSIRTAVRFKWMVWELRRNYDAVFVHMNPEYILVAGPLWRLLGKRVILWYNHPHGGWKLALAARIADEVLYTSPHAASASLKNATRMPAGIDTDLFSPQGLSRDRRALYLQGRVAPSKRIHVALAALRLLRQRLPATLSIVGPEDEAYAAELRSKFADLIADGAVTFHGPKRNDETPRLYASHGAAINLAASGHFDKSVLEAMACETPVVLASAGFEGLVPHEWTVPRDDAGALAAALEKLITLSEGKYRVLGQEERTAVIASQGLPALADRLVEELSV